MGRKFARNFDQFCVILCMSECLLGLIVTHQLGLIRLSGSNVDVCTKDTKDRTNFVLYVCPSVGSQQLDGANCYSKI